MKIALPTMENCIDNHFGHCAYYTIVTVEDGKIVAKETMPSPQGCGCKSGIAAVFEEMGITLMLAGNMGEGAKNTLESHHIQVVRGCSGNVEDVVNAYIAGQVKDSGIGCDHHDCTHHDHE